MNWTILSNAFEPVVSTFLSDPESPKALKEGYKKLPYLDGIHSISLIVGDHAFNVEFKGFDVLNLLPAPDKIVTVKKQDKAKKTGRVSVSNGEYKLVVMGDTGVGKSAMVIQFVQNTFLECYDPTIEDSYRKQVSIDDQTCLLDIMDTAEQYECSSMTDQYIRTGQAFVLMYSITSRASFEAVRNYYERILRTKDLEAVAMVLVGNKADLEPSREVTTTEGAELAKSWNIPFFEASAKTRMNAQELFFQAVREAVQYI